MWPARLMRRARLMRHGPPGTAGLGDPELLRLAVALEGHPDNVSACLAGELVISWTSASGASFVRLATVAGLAPVLCVPDSELSTSAARQALPAAVPHAEAAANSARAALLVTALTSRPRPADGGDRGLPAPALPRRRDAGHGEPGQRAAGGRHPGCGVRRRPGGAGAHCRRAASRAARGQPPSRRIRMRPGTSGRSRSIAAVQSSAWPPTRGRPPGRSGRRARSRVSSSGDRRTACLP